MSFVQLPRWGWLHKAVGVVFLAVVALLTGCAADRPLVVHDSWALKPGWTKAASFDKLDLVGGRGRKYRIQGVVMENLKAALLDIQAQSRVDADIVLTSGETPNAFATTMDGSPVIGFTLTLLDALGRDKDALATVIGHELAHIKLNHGHVRKNRSASAKNVGNVVGVLLELAGVPLGGAIADVGVGMATTAYSRDDEREADELGLQWAIAAGYSPCGSARAMQVLEKYSGGVAIPFFASHPGTDERIERANRAAIKVSGQGC